MSKSIAIVHKPKTCGECRFLTCRQYLDPSGFDYYFDCSLGGEVSENCPLTDLPKKKPTGKGKTLGTYNDGWNDCLKTILGERR